MINDEIALLERIVGERASTEGAAVSRQVDHAMLRWHSGFIQATGSKGTTRRCLQPKKQNSASKSD